MGQTLRRAAVLLALAVAPAAATTTTGAASTPRSRCPAITFQVTGDPEETRVYKELAEPYKQETGRTVNVDEVPERDAHLAKLTTGFSAGQGARRLPAQLPLPRRLRRPPGDRPGRPAARQLGRVRRARTSTRCRCRRSSTTARCSASRRTRRASPSTTTSTRSRRPASRRRRTAWTYEEFTAAADKLTGDGPPRRRHRPQHDPRRAVGVGRRRRARRRRDEPDAVPVRHARRAGAASST